MTESSCYWQCLDRNLILHCQCARSEHGVITSKILEEKILVYLEDTSCSRISAWQMVGVLRKQNVHTSAGQLFREHPTPRVLQQHTHFQTAPTPVPYPTLTFKPSDGVVGNQVGTWKDCQIWICWLYVSPLQFLGPSTNSVNVIGNMVETQQK
jgi:hypothetical protein